MGRLKNHRYEKFCRAYVATMNQTTSYLQAGFKVSENANKHASRLMKRDDVAARIGELIEKQAKKLDISSDKIITEYARLAFSDILDVVEIEDTEIGKEMTISSNIVDKNISPAIKSITVKNGQISVTLHDKIAALGILYKHFIGDAEPNKEKIKKIVFQQLPKAKND